MPKPIKKAARRSGGAKVIKLKSKKPSEELGKKILSKGKNRRVRTRRASATNIEERIKQRKADESIVLKEHMDKQIKEDNSHGYHMNKETHHINKSVEINKIKKEIKQIDHETLEVIKAMEREKVRGEVNRLQGVKSQLASEIKKLDEIKKTLRKNRKHNSVPEAHLEFIHQREYRIQNQIKKINDAISGLSKIHSISTKEGGNPSKMTRVKHALGLKKAA